MEIEMLHTGRYYLAKLTRNQFIDALRASGECDSYVGYPQTAEFVERISGVKVEVSRRQTVLTDGERMLVVKLSYRIQDAGMKGAPVNEDDYEFFQISYYV